MGPTFIFIYLHMLKVFEKLQIILILCACIFLIASQHNQEGGGFAINLEKIKKIKKSLEPLIWNFLHLNFDSQHLKWKHVCFVIATWMKQLLIPSNNQNYLRKLEVHNRVTSSEQCPGRFWGIVDRDRSVPKSNQLHVDIFPFPLINSRYIL